MMLRGAAKTAMLTMAETHPTKNNLFELSSASKEIAIINPNPPPLNSTINLTVKLCKKD